MKSESDSSAPQDLKSRTTAFAARVVRVYVSLPKRTEAQVLGQQLLRSGTSVGANYREAFRARSDAEFISKLEIVLQELDESDYWMELLVTAGIVSEKKLSLLRSEISELSAIFVATVRKVKNRRSR